MVLQRVVDSQGVTLLQRDLLEEFTLMEGSQLSLAMDHLQLLVHNLEREGSRGERGSRGEGGEGREREGGGSRGERKGGRRGEIKGGRGERGKVRSVSYLSSCQSVHGRLEGCDVILHCWIGPIEDYRNC